MVRLSVNVNKIATIRNSRGGAVPDLIEAVEACLAAGAQGITVHPRADRRHINPHDVRRIKWRLAGLRDQVEFNIEGDPRPELLELVHEVRPHQCTLVPVQPGEVTSRAGWGSDTSTSEIRQIVQQLKSAGVRTSLFVDPDSSAVQWAAHVEADRVELFTEPFARAFQQSSTEGTQSFARYSEAARIAHTLGLGVNAGHDLDLGNLVLFRKLPHLDEVSIGHALVSRALFVGLTTVVREYLAVLNTGG